MPGHIVHVLSPTFSLRGAFRKCSSQHIPLISPQLNMFVSFWDDLFGISSSVCKPATARLIPSRRMAGNAPLLTLVRSMRDRCAECVRDWVATPITDCVYWRVTFQNDPLILSIQHTGSIRFVYPYLIRRIRALNATVSENIQCVLLVFVVIKIWWKYWVFLYLFDVVYFGRLNYPTACARLAENGITVWLLRT